MTFSFFVSQLLRYEHRLLQVYPEVTNGTLVRYVHCAKNPEHNLHLRQALLSRFRYIYNHKNTTQYA